MLSSHTKVTRAPQIVPGASQSLPGVSQSVPGAFQSVPGMLHRAPEPSKCASEGTQRDPGRPLAHQMLPGRLKAYQERLKVSTQRYLSAPEPPEKCGHAIRTYASMPAVEHRASMPAVRHSAGMPAVRHCASMLAHTHRASMFLHGKPNTVSRSREGEEPKRLIQAFTVPRSCLGRDPKDEFKSCL